MSSVAVEIHVMLLIMLPLVVQLEVKYQHRPYRQILLFNIMVGLWYKVVDYHAIFSKVMLLFLVILTIDQGFSGKRTYRLQRRL